MPPAILEKIKAVILSIDVMHVNKLPFLIGKLHHINYYHAIPMLKKNADCIKDAIDKMKAEYGRRGGTVIKLLGDIAFDCMKTELGLNGVTIVTLDKGRHVPVVERAIGELKGRIRAARIEMNQYKQIPKRLTIMLVESVVVYINGITKAHNDLHVVQSPQRIVTGLPLHMPKANFGLSIWSWSHWIREQPNHTRQ